MTERKVKKDTQEKDTCRDCWRARFRESMMELLSSTSVTPSEFFDTEISLREKSYDEMRSEARDIYEEINEVRALAGDVFMERYPPKKGDD